MKAPLKAKLGNDSNSLAFEFLDNVDFDLNGFQVNISNLEIIEAEDGTDNADLVFDVYFDEKELLERVKKDLHSYISDAIMKIIEKAVEEKETKEI